jgi:mRNA-degrading endonuclease YafQ of YafQ-DinJ toxin-antitoxin module
MRIFVTAHFKRKYRKLAKKDHKLSKTVDKKIALFRDNLNHSSLRLHKLASREIDEWSISIKGNLRIVFQYVKGGVLMTDIGSHDEVY